MLEHDSIVQNKGTTAISNMDSEMTSELIALNRNIGRRAPIDEEETRLQGGAASVLKKLNTSERKPNLRAVTKYL